MNRNKWFSARILQWYSQNKRDLPWRHTKDPYLVWLSEIILQQTRVEQGLPYYQRFAKDYPTVDDLAVAHEDEVLKAWEGLGYYSRARNLHSAAKFVSNELNGRFPSNYSQLLDLKGVGPYTAAAVSSISSAEPVAVVDGNVYRVLARVFGIDVPIDSTPGKKLFSTLANELLSTENPGDHNQAVMEFGATMCTPNRPNCPDCIFQDKCLAFASKNVSSYPVKVGRTKVRDRYFNFFLIENVDGRIALEKRGTDDIWRGLYQFPLVESSFPENGKMAAKLLQKKLGADAEIRSGSSVIKHVLSHQRIHALIWTGVLTNHEIRAPHWLFVEEDALADYPLPRLLTRWLESQN